MNLVGLQFREKNIQKKIKLKLETPQFRLKSIDGFYCVRTCKQQLVLQYMKLCQTTNINISSK